MAKASSGALSTFVTTPEGEERVRAYKEAQENLRQALDARENQLFDPTLLAISQALASPTKTGSFGEVLGNVAGAINTSQQSEEKRARDIAAMRLELAQQGLQSHQATEAMQFARDLVANKLPGQPTQSKPPEGAAMPSEGAAKPPEGLAPDQAPAARPAQPTTGGGLSHVTGSHLVALTSMGRGDLADSIAKAISVDQDRFKFADGVIVDLRAQGGPKMIADLRVGKQEPTEIVVGGKSLNVMMNPSEQRDFLAASAQGRGDEFYDKFLKGRRTDVNQPSAGSALREISVPLLGDVVFRGTERQAAMIERLSEEALRTSNPTALRDYVNSIRQPMAMPTAPQAQATPTAPGQPPAPAVTARPPAAQPAQQPVQQPAAQTTSDLSGLPLADQEKIMIERLSAADKPAQETMAVLMKSAGPETTVASNQRLNELVTIINNNPKVVGLMNKEGVIAGIAAAAQQGLQVGSTSVSLPVTTFLEKAKLTPQEQQVARRVAQLLDQEFFNRAALAKSALGPQISNTDAIAMKSPMARPEDGAQLIKYWSLHGVLVNKQNDELVSSYNSWMDRTKGRQPTRQFWNTEGRKILNQYTPYFQKLEKDFSPTGSR
jgi:flagellar hook-basal body complex protein FliE